MFVNGIGGAASTYAPSSLTAGRQKSLDTFGATGTSGASAQLTLSDEAKAAADADARLAEIAAKPESARTAEEIDYQQKAGGFVNTMANLSPDEKKLYNELVAKGETEAVRAMNLLALSRMGGGEVTLPDGTSFDPAKTAITPDNIRKLFSKMFVSDDSQDARSFEALASYLDGRQNATA
ncbi:MAG TPA: hypothetical protein H9903_16110 [Candidatus Aquabacterium excrementipullorum]|nr:hypothetical protein [Candidatus Aquabacterium excrementipullorum]